MKKREKSAIITTFANAYNYAIASLMPFIIRTLLIKYIGIEYLGIRGLFESFLQILSIVNFGIDSSFFSFFLYKPCEQKDYNTVNAIMGLLRKIYIALSIITIGIGFLSIPLLPYFVAGKLYPEDVNIYYIFIIYILQNVSSYFVGYLVVIHAPLLLSHITAFGYGTAFLIMYVIQIWVIVFLQNFTLYTLGILIANPLLYIFFNWYNKKEIKWLTYKGALSKDFISDFRKRLLPMFILKIRNISRNSIDCIIISNCLGLIVLAQYQNYYQILLIPLMIINLMNAAIQPALGNGISTESPESNYGILKQFTFVQNFVATICVSCLITLIQPFMKFWVGGQYLLGTDIVVCVGVYFYVLCIAGIGVFLRDTTGTWKYGMWISIVETVLNIVFNIIFIKILGLWGIILASILTVSFINIPFEFGYVFKYYFLNNYGKYMFSIIRNTIITIIISAISYVICIRIAITNYFMILVRFCLAIIVPLLLFLIFHFKDEEFLELKSFIKKIVTGRSNKWKKE